MALTPLSKMLEAARIGRYAVGYFEAWDTYSFEAVAEAAEAEQSPVVLGFGGMMMEPAWLDRFGVEPLGSYGRALADRLTAPAALILNEVREPDHARRGVDAGFNVVMLDTSELPFEQNVQRTRDLVATAHPRGVEVQAELGRLPDFGAEGSGELTDPGLACEFVEATGADFLAISVGNMHMRTEGAAEVDWERLRSIRQRAPAPLVIHGGSGLSPETVGALIAEGIALFHVGTVLKRRYWESVQASCAGPPGRLDYQALVGSRKAGDFLAPAKSAVAETVRSLMRLYGSAGKAVVDGS